MFKCFIIVLCLLLNTINCYAELADPTKPPDSAEKTRDYVASTNLQLTAIVISPQHRTAIINEQVVEVGDTIAGFQVMEIQPHGVKLHGPSGTFLLPLVEQPIKNYHQPTAVDRENMNTTGE